MIKKNYISDNARNHMLKANVWDARMDKKLDDVRARRDEVLQVVLTDIASPSKLKRQHQRGGLYPRVRYQNQRSPPRYNRGE